VNFDRRGRKEAREFADLLALCTRRLVERSTQAFRELHLVTLAQKCRKNRRSCSSSIWLWIAVTFDPALQQSLNDRIDFVARPLEISRDSCVAAVRRLTVNGKRTPWDRQG
jgi:hypothetical protein